MSHAISPISKHMFIMLAAGAVAGSAAAAPLPNPDPTIFADDIGGSGYFRPIGQGTLALEFFDLGDSAASFGFFKRGTPGDRTPIFEASDLAGQGAIVDFINGVVFDVAVFLNLGRDHLDFHTDLEDYFRAKASLFTPERTRLGLVDVDDDHGRRLAAEATVPVRTFSAAGADADWRAEDVEVRADGSSFTVVTPDGTRLQAACPLPGRFNVVNTLAGIAAASEVGLDPVAVAADAGRPA